MRVKANILSEAVVKSTPLRSDLAGDLEEAARIDWDWIDNAGK